jgi:hypothetical protein
MTERLGFVFLVLGVISVVVSARMLSSHGSVRRFWSGVLGLGAAVGFLSLSTFLLLVG